MLASELETRQRKPASHSQGWGGGTSQERTGRRFGGCWEEQGVPLRQGDYKTLLWPEMVREELTVAQGDGFPRAWGGGGEGGRGASVLQEL